ncbi:MAG: hypothetical protein K6A96_09290 [Prevotella sp.]|nr:hypothetical protein [Prevotella sp.]
MTFKSENITIGNSGPQPITDMLQKLADSELPESEFWRIMCYFQNLAAQTNDGNLLRQLDNIKRGRFGKPFPLAEVTTPQNLPAKGKLPDEKLNLNAPRINLQRMLEGSWFAANCTNKEKYNTKWVAQFVKSLMDEHGLYLAKEWKKRHGVIKGQVAGALLSAGVLKGMKLTIARAIHGEEKNTKEIKTFARYMGRLNDKLIVDYILNYVKEEK